jgi:hypothetical protein
MANINWRYLDSKGLLVDPATLVKQTNGEVLVMRVADDLSAVYLDCRICGDINNADMRKLRNLRDRASEVNIGDFKFRPVPASMENELIRFRRKERGIPLDLPIGRR